MLGFSIGLNVRYRGHEIHRDPEQANMRLAAARQRQPTGVM
jgi:hypothetical protein